MSIPNPIRVAAIHGDRSAPEWHARVIDSVRAVRDVDVVEVPADAHVVIDFSGASSRLQPLFGVWRYAFGDGSAAAAGAKGTLARVYRVTDDPARAIVLHEGWYRAPSRDAWGTPSVGQRVAPWCARVLRQMTCGRIERLCAAAQDTAGCIASTPPHDASRLTIGAAEVARDWFRRQRWTIGVVPSSIDDVLQRGALPEPAWLEGQPGDRFYADPFPIGGDDGRVELLVEEYRYGSRQKLLTQIEVTRAGELIAARRATGLPRHASYPFVLRPDGRDGELLCIPETFRDARVAAYQKNGDDSWRLCAELLSGFPAVDPTIVQHAGRWWMFCMKQGEEDQTELYAFFADDWRGPWAPHMLNPVKSDTRSSRPAGRFIHIDGRLYRPAQNCAARYGGGITVNRVLELTPSGFREEPVTSFEPVAGSRWPDGLHTINSIGSTTIVDGLRVERRLGPARFTRR
jgi:hypothetical protein